MQERGGAPDHHHADAIAAHTEISAKRVPVSAFRGELAQVLHHCRRDQPGVLTAIVGAVSASMVWKSVLF